MNIVVLAGGTSTERDVSINTGRMVCGALRQRGHNAVIMDVFLGHDNADIFKVNEDYDLEAEVGIIKSRSGDIERIRQTRSTYFGDNVIAICQSADVVFIALHGGNGENGKLQAVFDLYGIKYTGSGCLASGMAMDKGISKKIFTESGVPTAKSAIIKKGKDSTRHSDYGIEIPCVVKTCCGGSSVGVYIAKTEQEYEKAIADAFIFEDEVLIEQFIEGREFSVGVLDGKALPVIEIVVSDGFYDYTNKYKAGAATEICPAEIDDAIAEDMKRNAETAVSALKIEVYGRVDFMLDKENNMYALEVNNLPGMTSTSLIPQEAAAVGIDFAELCEKIVMMSLEKTERNII